MADALPPPDPTTRAHGGPHAHDDAVPAVPPTERDPRPRPPAGRPAWAVPAAVGAGLLLAFIVVYSLAQGLGGDDDGAAPGDAWNAIASVDPETGDVTIRGREGGEAEVIETGIDSALLRTISPRRLVVENDEDAALIDLEDTDVHTFEMPADTDVFWSLGDEPVLFFAAASGADIHVPTADGELVAVGAAVGWDEPLIVPFGVVSVDDGSTLVATTLGGDEATAIVDVGDGDVTTVPGVLLTLDDTSVTTRVRGADDTTVIERFDLDGESRGTVEVTVALTSVLSGDGDTLIGVTAEGAVLRLSVDGDGGASEEVAQLDVDEQIDQRTILFGETPIVVASDALDDRTNLYVVRADGSTTGPIELEGELDRIVAGRGESPCAVVSGPERAALVRLDDGDVVQTLEVDQRVMGAHADDACVAVLLGAESVLMTPDRTITAPEDTQFLAVSPDGEWVAMRTRTADGDTVTVALPIEDLTDDGTVDDDADAAIDLGPPGSIQFVQRG